MPKLIYSAILSLDGYIEDEKGEFEWAQPDEEIHAFINDLERPVSTYLLGRRMYETLKVWETDPSLANQGPILRDYAQIWRAADKIVYSTTLEQVSTTKTRLEREFDPEAVKQLKSAAKGDISIGGPGLAAHAFAEGLVDECQVFIVPVILGGGKPGLPGAAVLRLELDGQRRFAGGMVYLRYRSAGTQTD